LTKEKGRTPRAANVCEAKTGARGSTEVMPIVMFLGRNVKEYEKKSEEIINQQISSGGIQCDQCLLPMARHSCYERRIKETGDQITITMVWCRGCNNWHSLQPDFLLPRKHYSGNEIESVIIDSATEPAKLIDTAASESTIRRWIRYVNERIRQAVGVLKYLFGRAGQAVNEVTVVPGAAYSELEQILELAPHSVNTSGNKLGLANIWLGTNTVPIYI